MGFLSKLLGDSKAGNDALNMLKGAARDAINEAAEKLNAQQNAPRQQSAAPVQRSAPASGFSWGEVMPAEENQFSFAGNYVQYFEKIFREDFPAYRLETQAQEMSRYTVFTLWEGGRQALIVEVKSENSSSQKLRRACQSNGVPYLRFYFDHNGWWNTRAYVVDRVRRALNG